ncbi:HAD-IC family P-type ATPase [Schaalia sp. lx-260]|uniref:HAD-IC family P-type ATPase n=1 Tax=Schaalia sp. lx-260 TaxID=2899082 RepID=UPI001E4C8D4C|nr:HAD-IC family P-type ATPase [Schaalia sp. lx-260]MCD4549351.1 HAD-IC family P-type ATPase [Schaalia sp. lx-260]
MSDQEHVYAGLSEQDVAQRVQMGQINTVSLTTSRSLVSIIRANVFTLFNGILTVAALIILIFGHVQDVVFSVVMIVNAAIGIFSEWRSKRTLDALAIVDAPRAHVRRSNGIHELGIEEVVLDDLIEVALGDQICADGILLESQGLEVDESMLTGESRPVRKKVTDQVLAGTSVVAGKGLIRATAVGEDLYAQGIARQAREFSVAVSEIQTGVNHVLRAISLAILPIVVVTVWTQTRIVGEGFHGTWATALVLAVAAVVGMIPQGLVLLTSMNFAIGAAALARKNVLVQELPAVEILARVDALCLDKTGTLTTGGIRVSSVLTVNSQYAEKDVRAVLTALNVDSTNPTAEAIAQYYADEKPLTDPQHTVVAFSSARKWSAWSAPTHGTWIFGAPELVVTQTQVLEQVSAIADTGRRVVALVHADEQILGEELPATRQAVALVILEEELRDDARETLQWFADQEVRVRVISGDNPRTVAALAHQLGLMGPDGQAARACDARDLPADLHSQEFIEAIRDHDVFGRVTPEQKRAMVSALQSENHCVAMTGDGVNDALALKEADLGIAMGNAARASKAVAQIVLLDGRFSQLPEVVARGRRIIANMERVSALFFAKTTYATVLVLLTALLSWRFPFLPRHYTYIGSLTIGIPAFFIALGPNTRRYISGFLSRTLSMALPAGFIMACAALGVNWWIGGGSPQAATAATVTMMAGGLWLLSITARPLVLWRVILLVTVAGSAIGGILLPPTRAFFALMWPTPDTWMVILLVSLCECALIEVAYRLNMYIAHRKDSLTQRM